MKETHKWPECLIYLFLFTLGNAGSSALASITEKEKLLCHKYGKEEPHQSEENKRMKQAQQRCGAPSRTERGDINQKGFLAQVLCKPKLRIERDKM